MEGASISGPVDPPAQAEQPQLKAGAISFLSSVVIGVASTAPGYSLAAALGIVTFYAGFSSPSIMLVAFVPMLCIAAAYFYMNKADPDCGTTFSWVTRAIGPRLGWMGGWGIIVTDIIVMPNLAAIAGSYSFQLFGNASPTTFEVTAVGVVWIIVMTGICYYGTELSAKSQQILLGIEFSTLIVFSIVALIKVYSGHKGAHGSHVHLGWFNPFNVHGFNNFTEGILAAVFIYWGWDSGVAVNEETENPGDAPGRAALVSTVVLVGIYVLVAVAALAYAGPALLSNNSDDIFAVIGHPVLGSGLDKLLIISVLTSASASTQTTILPTARTALSMGRSGAIPSTFGRIHPRFLTPSVATLSMGAASIVWYVTMTLVSTNILNDSILALGLGIAFYYGITGVACIVYYRRELARTAKNFMFMGVLPALGSTILFALFIKSCFDLGKTDSGSTVIFGLGGPLVIGLGALLLGVPFMIWARYGVAGATQFFSRKRETATPEEAITAGGAS